MRRTSWLVPLLAVAAGGCGRGGSAASSQAAAPDAKPVVEVSTAKAVLSDLRATVMVTGIVSPLPNEEAKISPLAAGRIKAVFVKTGDRVRKGQIVATLDPGSAAGQVRQAEAAVRVAQATVRQATVNLTSQTRTQAATVAQARTNLDTQRVALAKLRAGSRPQEIAQAQANVASAQATLTTATQSLSRSQTLFSEGLLARKDLEAAQAAERTARAALVNSEQALSLVRQGNRPEDIRAGAIAVVQAQQQLRAAYAQSVQNQSKAQDIRIAEGQHQSAMGALQSAKAQANALSIVSPLTGTVVGRTVNAGESVDVTSAIATVVNLDRVRLLLNVPSDQIQTVTANQLVEFSIDSEPGAVRQAKVSVVNRAVDPATNTVVVEALADNADGKLKDDSFVRAAIVTQSHPRAVSVPSAALVDKEGKTVVYVAGSDGIAHAKEVEAGLKERGQVEIKSGIALGETVVTTGSYELDDGTQIKVAK